MALTSTLFTGLSGLDANTTRLTVVGKVAQGNAAKGFLQQARTLGRGPGFGEDDRANYRREFTGAVAMLKSRIG